MGKTYKDKYKDEFPLKKWKTGKIGKKGSNYGKYLPPATTYSESPEDERPEIPRPGASEEDSRGKGGIPS